MRVLIVTCSFPPENVIGAVRVGKFAKFLLEKGHEVRVIAALPGADTSLPLEIPSAHIIYAHDWNVDALFDPWIKRLQKRSRPSSMAVAGVSRSRDQSSLSSRLKPHYYALLRIPDSRAGWRANAIAAGCRLIDNEWRPDLIFASSPPTISLFVAAALGKRYHIPWVGELRDLWAANPYYSFPAWRRVVDRILERHVLRKASLLVTVSPPWARTLQSNYGNRVATVLNGYAEEDYIPGGGGNEKPPGPLSIVYTGNIYAGFRDPSPLFKAISRLPPESRAALAVRFYGSSVAELRGLIEQHALTDCVSIHGAVSYRDSVLLQRSADVLLLLQWNDPGDAGNIPAKFFEYMAAGRPILMLGYEKGVLAQMIRERGAGFIANQPDLIAAQLNVWIGMRRNGAVAGLDATTTAGFSRREQFLKLEGLLSAVVESK